MTNIVISIFFLTMSIRFGACIRCYECNSANNSMCLEPALYDAESVHKYLHRAECERAALGTAPAGTPLFCRKIVQTILHKGHDPEVRVTRGCGWVRHRRDCYKADNDDHLETVCQCFSDECNAAAGLRARRLAAILAVGAVSAVSAAMLA